MTTVVNVPDSERNQTIYRLNQEENVSPSELAAMFRLAPRTISRILQEKGRPLIPKMEPVPINVPEGALQADFKPFNVLATGTRRSPLYPGACTRCKGTMEVDLQHKDARCINCGYDPLLKPAPWSELPEFCDGGGADPWRADIATKVFHCPVCYRRVELSKHGTVPSHKAVKV